MLRSVFIAVTFATALCERPSHEEAPRQHDAVGVAAGDAEQEMVTQKEKLLNPSLSEALAKVSGFTGRRMRKRIAVGVNKMLSHTVKETDDEASDVKRASLVDKIVTESLEEPKGTVPTVELWEKMTHTQGDAGGVHLAGQNNPHRLTVKHDDGGRLIFHIKNEDSGDSVKLVAQSDVLAQKLDSAQSGMYKLNLGDQHGEKSHGPTQLAWLEKELGVSKSTPAIATQTGPGYIVWVDLCTVKKHIYVRHDNGLKTLVFSATT